MKFFPIMKTAFLALMILMASVPSAAEQNELTKVEGKTEDGKVEITLTFTQKPDLQLYFGKGFDTLYIDVIDARQSLTMFGMASFNLRGDPPPGVSRWGAEPNLLHRARVWMSLQHRPRPGSLKKEVLENPWRAVVSFDMAYHVHQEYPISASALWCQTEVANTEGYTKFNEVIFKPTAEFPKLRLGIPRSRQRLEALNELWEARGMTAALNGGYFANDGSILGLLYRKDALLSPSMTQPALMQDTDGSVHIDDFGDGEVPKENTRLALGGVSRLLRDGKFEATGPVLLGQTSVPLNDRRGRSVVATTLDGRVILATASGYRGNDGDGEALPVRYRTFEGNPNVRGTTLKAMSERMRNLGAHQALTLPGGRNVQMLVHNQCVSRGPAQTEASLPVGSALLLDDEGNGNYPARLELLGPLPQTLLADGESSVRISGRALNQNSRPVAGARVLVLATRMTTSAPLQTDEDGKFEVELKSRSRVGKALIQIESGAALLKEEVFLHPGPPKIIRTQAYKGGHGFRSYRIQVLDAHLNPIPNQKLKLDGKEVTTGERAIWWDDLEVPAEGRDMLIQVEGLPDKTVFVSG